MSDLFGVIGVFESPDAVRKAASRLRESGYRSFEAYTPYPVDGLQDIIHPGPSRFLPLFMFGGAVFGACWGYWIQAWGEVVNYPINVGGRPYNSWPAFMVGTFEFMVLCAVAAGLFGLLCGVRPAEALSPDLRGQELRARIARPVPHLRRAPKTRASTRNP